MTDGDERSDADVIPLTRRPPILLDPEWVLDLLREIPKVFDDEIMFRWRTKDFDPTTDVGVARMLDVAHHIAMNVRSVIDQTVYRQINEWRSERRPCRGVTEKGRPCQQLAPEGRDYCSTHRRQAPRGTEPPW